MGGTSTDVARFDGRYELEYETEKAGVRVVAPMMAIETVAAGGGSICHFDGVKLAVGPDSAGADPGPACYGRGGPLAVTDLNFYLGKILPERFPFPLDRRGGGNAVGGAVRRDRRRNRQALLADRAGGRLLAGRQRQHGQGDPLDFDRQRVRPARLRAGGVRRRGGATCLRRGARTGHQANPQPSRRGLVERLRHRAGRRRASRRRRRLSAVLRDGGDRIWTAPSSSSRMAHGRKCGRRAFPTSGSKCGARSTCGIGAWTPI